MNSLLWWQYLTQPLGDPMRPAILNPIKYWHYRKAQCLDSCLSNDFLERCWAVDYQEFVAQYHALCTRHPLEEDPVWLLKRCWHLKRQGLYSYHPENCSQENS